MPPDTPPDQQAIGMLITVLVFGLLIWLRNRKPRRLKIELLWIRPVIVLLVLGGLLAATRPELTPVSLGLMVAGLAVGCAAGWQRGRFIHIEVDPKTRVITSRTSPLGMIFIVVLLLARTSLKSALTAIAAPLHVPVTAATDALILMAVGMMATQGLEMWLRARRLLAEAKASAAITPAEVQHT